MEKHVLSTHVESTVEVVQKRPRAGMVEMGQYARVKKDTKETEKFAKPSKSKVVWTRMQAITTKRQM